MVLLGVGYFKTVDVEDPVSYIYSELETNDNYFLLEALTKLVDIKDHMLRLAHILEKSENFVLFRFLANLFENNPDPEVFEILFKKAKIFSYDDHMIELGSKIRNSEYQKRILNEFQVKRYYFMLCGYIYTNAFPNILRIKDIKIRDEILAEYVYHEKCGLMPQIVSENMKLLIPLTFPEKSEVYRCLKRIMIPVLSKIVLDYVDDKITKKNVLGRLYQKRGDIFKLVDDHSRCQ